MPFKTKLTLAGFDEYLEKITAAGQAIDPVTAQALVAGADVLKAGMRERVAKDTRHLEESIDRTAPVQDGNFHFIEIGLVKVDSATERQALAQEYGWADHQGAKAGHPYIRPTLDTDMGKARAAMRKVFKTAGVL